MNTRIITWSRSFQVARQAVVLAGLFLINTLQAAEIVWTNSSGGNWNVAANWDPNQVPGATDDVAITAGGTYTVSVNASTTVNSLTLGGASGQQSLTTIGYPLTLTDASVINANGVFNLDGGAGLAGTSQLTVHGQFNWYSGNISPGTALTVANDGFLALTSGNSHYFYGVLTNAGTIQLVTGNNNLALQGSYYGVVCELVNLPGGLVDIQGDNSISPYQTELVLNQGTIRKSAGTRTTTISTLFTNSGTLDVQTGTINLNNSGQGNGVFLPEAGATLIFNGPYEVDNNLTGTGTILLNYGTFTLNGNINGSNVVLNGANLVASNTVINSGLTWSYGNINPGSIMTVATNGWLTLASGGTHSFNGTRLTNAGTIQLLAGNNLALQGSYYGVVSELVNLPGALVDIQGDNSISPYSTEPVVNQGTVRKSAGTGTTTISTLFTNSGTLDVQTGTVNLNNAGRGHGIFSPEAGATLIFNGSYEVDNNLTGAGTNLLNYGTFTLNGNINGANVELNNGTFTLNGNINGSNVVLNGANLVAVNTVINSALNWNNGYINPGSIMTVGTNGWLILTSGNVHYCYGMLTNAGTVELLAGNNLVLQGGCEGGEGELVNLPGGLVDIQGDNSINQNCGTELLLNQGVVRKSAGTGTTTISTLFTNTGTLDIQTGTVNLNGGGQGSGGFLPEAGATLIFSSTYEVDGSLNGPGTFLLNGGTFTLNGNINGTNVVLNGANLVAVNTVINSALNWNNGYINPGSIMTVATNGWLILTSGNVHSFYGMLTNAGTVQLLAGNNLVLQGSCVGGVGELVNLPGGLVDIQGDNSINPNCGTELLLNQGVVRKSAGTGTAIIGTLFTNSGTLDIQTGTVNLNGSGQGSGGFLPEAGATLIFSRTYEVDGSLNGVGTILLNSGTFTLNGNINGSNVVLNGANLVAVNTVINSALTWNNGYINPGTVMTVATNGLLTLTSGNLHSFYGMLTNAGTVQLLAGNNLVLQGSCVGGVGELVNLPGGLVDIQGDNSINPNCGTELLLNQGVVRKSAGTGTTTIGTLFTNSGTLDIQTGTIKLSNSGQGGGVFLPEAGATLIFNDSYELDCNLIGAGTNLLSNGTFTLNGNINGSNVVLNGANLEAGNTVINSALTWNNGNINPGSIMTVATNGWLTLISGNVHDFYGMLTNAGTVQLLTGNSLWLIGSCQDGVGELVNLPGALVDIQGDNSISQTCGTEMLLNQGVVLKSAGSGTTTISTLFTNSGMVKADSGTMSFTHTYIQDSGQTVLNGGGFTFSQMAEFLGGNLTGTGTINGSISNNATIGTGTSPGLLAISGDYLESPNAHLAIKLGGILAGTNYDQLSVGGNAALAGTLGVSYWNGFTPALGSYFAVLACNARTGFFTAVTAPVTNIAAVYGANAVTVELGHAPPIATLSLPTQSLAGHTFLITASGTDLDGAVTNMTLFLGTNTLLTSAGSSAQVSYSTDFPGTLTFTAVATDSYGVQGTATAKVGITTLPLRTLDPVGFQSDLSFKLCMLGVAGTNYQILASTNLEKPAWTAVGTMESTNGIWRFLDPSATNFSHRFYRAQQEP